ncbi:hypothetical protein [Amycolatopsis sp. NPDC004079]|uniref:hypothetical protein n=1 Tax=Amycolatopsis sp. NPDC004079 TaxID=3154549 RepID=UPI0033B18F6F
MTARRRGGGPSLLQLTNEDPEFYPLLGPFLSRREVVGQVGGPIWDDDAKTWIVATAGSGFPSEVAGFVGVAVRGRTTVVESLYLAPGQEQAAAALLDAAVTRFGDRPLHAVVCLAHRDAYLAAGFAETTRSKNFSTLDREATPR